VRGLTPADKSPILWSKQLAKQSLVTADSTQSQPFRAPWALFWVAITIRLVFLLLGKLYVIPPMLDHTKFGSEAGHIARALLAGRGYSDPFDWSKTGPTAWLAPGYPLLLAAIFKYFGIYTNASAGVILAIQCVFNAAMARWVWEIGARCFGRRVGDVTGWIVALSPWSMLYALMLIWETSISTALFMFAIILTLRLRGIGGDGGYTWGRWTAWGFCWGMVALFNPSILVFLPCAGIWLLLGAEWPMARKLTGATVAGTIFLLMMAPWWIRNERVFHKFIPARGNLGAEFCLGNCHGIEGTLGQWDNLPWGIEDYVRGGEVAYNAGQMDQFKQVVRHNPVQFVEMSLLRFGFYWVGGVEGQGDSLGAYLSQLVYAFAGLAGLWGAWTAWRRKLPASGLFVMAILAMPTLYYLVETQERYRQPLEPLLYVLAIYAVVAAEKSWRVRWFGRSQSRLVFAEPVPEEASAARAA
jgi:hypothetical protein